MVTSDEKGLTNPTLFNTAGMQPLIPYLLGEPHPLGTRLVDVQKCLRTVDIDSIGDKTHATFFEMLGNWSLGDYFKKEAIGWSYDFLTSRSDEEGQRGLALNPNRLYVTVFEGDENAPRDDEAAQIWRETFKNDKANEVAGVDGDTSIGQPGRIFYMAAVNNWWQAGENGPCGPDSEMFYDVTNKFGGRPITKEEYMAADETRDVVEVWNDVFMQYEKKDGKIVGKLAKPSVDTGAGLERLAMVIQGKDNIYDTDLLKPVMDKIAQLSKNWDVKSARIVADHIKAAVFLIADGVIPSNTDRGYVLRKLIRRAIRNQKILNLNIAGLSKLAPDIIDVYKGIYEEIGRHNDSVIKILAEESRKFITALHNGDEQLMQIFKQARDKNIPISGKSAFEIFSSYGFPLEESLKQLDILNKDFSLGKDLYDKNAIVKDFGIEMTKHQDLSRSGAEQKFKGGLADANDEMVVRYHTATHLLHQALHDVLGEGVCQKGSNITTERLRFDFSYPSKLTDEQKKKVENIVNEKILESLPMNKVIMPRSEAEKTGARHFFGEKYGEEISIYYVGKDLESAYSKEFCGGPHVTNTAELAGPEGKWRFKITKEEAVAQGIRRIKAVLI